jgi:hypothetical protein
MNKMNKIEKSLIGIEIILVLLLSFIQWKSGGTNIITTFLGVFLYSALIPFILAIIFAREDKEKGVSRRLAQWKFFVKAYLPFLIISIIGSLA